MVVQSHTSVWFLTGIEVTLTHVYLKVLQTDLYQRCNRTLEDLNYAMVACSLLDFPPQVHLYGITSTPTS